MRVFLFVILSFKVFADLQTQTYAVTEGSPSALVAGAVNAITGDHYIAEMDYQIQAAVPLNLPRTYISSNGADKHAGWQLLHHLYAAYYVEEDEDPWHHRIQLIEPNGSTLNFERSQKQKKNQLIVFNPVDISKAKGLTNAGRGEISGQTNVKNIRVEMSSDRKNFTVYGADSAVRYYKQIKKPEESMPKELFHEAPTAWYVLQWEKLPNQTQVFYGYDGKDWLNAVRTANHNDTKTYAWAGIHYLSHNHGKNHDFDINTNDGRKLSYRFASHHDHSIFLLSNVDTPSYLQESISYDQKIGDGWGGGSGLTIGYLPTTRRLLENCHYKIDYYKVKDNYIGGGNIKLKNDDPRLYRVKTLSAPVGNDVNALVTHSFYYFPEQRYTQVREIDNILTQYHYSPELRLEKILRYGRNDVLQSSERFIWGTAGAIATNLLCHTFYDSSLQPLLSRCFYYDDRGNPIGEKLYGVLSGQQKPPLLIANDTFPIENGVESYTIHRKFSQDRLNLLLREEEQNGKVTLYNYLPNTSLLSSKFICDHEQIKIRNFYQYSPDYILIQEILDDGFTPNKDDLTGVLTRRIKNISLIPKGQPYQDMPNAIEESYWDGNKHVLLKRAYLAYTAGGRIEKQDIHDAMENHRYTLSMKYDGAGRLTEESNALKQTATYAYDGVGNKIFSQDFSGKKTTRMKYDFSNRLIQVEEIGSDGIKRITQHRYDTKHNRIATIDPYGNTTSYIPNPFGKIEENHLPPIVDAKGSFSYPIIYRRYDSSGREISTIEANGDVLSRSYNIRSQVTHILHPNQTTERFIYNLDGTLHSHIDQKGGLTEYSYDFLGRMTSKIDALGQVTTWIYNAFNLIAQIDAEGNKTTYEYDGAGRKVAEQINHERTEYFYDSLGRLQTVKKGQLLNISEFNHLDQVTEERQEDIGGTLLTRICYEYDEAGNKSVITRYVDGKDAKEFFFYDSFNRLIEYRDPFNHVTTTVFNDHFQNAHGQTVVQKVETDPLGLETITTYDAMGRIASLEKKNINRDSLTLEDNFYDVSGNLVQYIKNKTHTIEWQYGPMNLLKTLIEGGSKITEFTYTKSGLLEQKKKPDGTVLTNRYDLRDQLIEAISSDNAIHYTFIYNKIGQQIGAKDEVSQLTSWRRYDPLERLLQEKLSNGLLISSTYDEVGRKTSLELPDKSIVSYTYDALNLKSISRKGLTHYLASYDLDGNILEQELMGHLGKMTFTYDLLRRKTSTQASFNSQELEYDPVGNVIWLRNNRERQNFTYDALYHLTSEKNFSYYYDTEGNRVRKNQETYSHNHLHQIVSHLTYDPNGNPYLDHDTEYTYDALDRLLALKNHSHQISFSYDHRGRMMTQTVDGKEMLFIYDDAKEIGSADSSGKITQLRILNPDLPSERGTAVLLEIDGNYYYPLHDLFGNTKGLLDLDRKIYESYEYSVFGEGIKPSLNPWQFASKRICHESGLINFGNRFYDSNYGRWLTPDPAGFADDNSNLYLFVENNPFSKLDLYGLSMMSYHQHHEYTTLSEPNSSTNLTPLHDTDNTYKYSWEGTKSLLDNICEPQIQGSLQALAGVTEASLGVAITTLSYGAAAPLGTFMFVHGVDHATTGIHTAISGNHQSTATAQLLQKAGMSPEKASHWDNGANFVFTVGGGGLAYKLGQEATTLTMFSSGKIGMAVSNERALFNFTDTAVKHMHEVQRKIPVQILDKIIKSPMAVVKDPQGASNAMMHYSQVWKNGKLYNIEVLYNKTTNTIAHFQYTQKPMGPLKKVSK